MARTLYARLTERFAPERFNPLTRREMLKITLAASGGLLLSNCTNGPKASNGFFTKRIIIVGAGFSGLACAYELKAAGYEVVVLEARNRLSGRVLSFHDFLPQHNVEGGGELIGSNHPTWVAYKEKFKLDFLDVSDDKDSIAPLYLKGQRLNDAQAKKVWEEMDDILKPMTTDAEPIDADQPWNSPDAPHLDSRSTTIWLKHVHGSPLGKAAVESMLVANNGVPLDQQSYLGNLASIKGGGLEKYWTDTEVYRCKGGNQQLAQKLAAGIGMANIHLNTPVTRIEQSSAGVRVMTADGRQFSGDEIVLAVPPSVWSKIRIAPVLPPELAPQMGVDVKYLSRLKNRFWTNPAAKDSPNELSDGPISMTWDATDGQDTSDAANQAVLTTFSGGPAAQDCLDAGNPDAFIQAEIAKIYPAYTDAFLAGRFMAWPKDPWTMAAYSFPSPGQVTTVGPMLEKGFDRLHFAGEHCCYKFVGYMEGALNSGVAVARKIAIADGVLKA